jgi:hypothetical protein
LRKSVRFRIPMSLLRMLTIQTSLKFIWSSKRMET